MPTDYRPARIDVHPVRVHGYRLRDKDSLLKGCGRADGAGVMANGTIQITGVFADGNANT